jgi:hypothetical protein
LKKPALYETIYEVVFAVLDTYEEDELNFTEKPPWAARFPFA